MRGEIEVRWVGHGLAVTAHRAGIEKWTMSRSVCMWREGEEEGESVEGAGRERDC